MNNGSKAIELLFLLVMVPITCVASCLFMMSEIVRQFAKYVKDR